MVKMRIDNLGEIKIKGVNPVKAKGRMYYYHRASGARIKSPFGTMEFVDEVQALNDGAKPMKAVPGTWGALANQFLKSPEFDALSKRTQNDYKNRVLVYLRKMNHVPLIEINGPSMFRLRDAAHRDNGVRMANYVLQVMSRIFNWGKPRGYCKYNPAQGVDKVKAARGAKRANRPWTTQEVRAVLDHAEPNLKLVMAILAYTGLRSADAISLTWTAYKDGLFNYNPKKNGYDLWIAPPLPLQKAIEKAPRRAMTIASNSLGKQWQPSGLRSSWRRLRTDLEQKSLVGENLTLHGLRHTIGNLLAEEGFDTATIAKILGHKTETMAKHYSDRAKRMDASKRASATIAKIGTIKD